MQGRVLQEIRNHRNEIRQCWDVLLRMEPVATPLANPDMLIRLFDSTFEQVLAAAADGSEEETPYDCPCRRNPLIAYFEAGRQAIRQALVLIQVRMTDLGPTERREDLRALDLAFQAVAKTEIEAFCGVCQFRLKALPAANEAFDSRRLDACQAPALTVR